MALAVLVAGTLVTSVPLVASVLDDPAAVEEGRSLYGRRCFVCHLAEGGRGPNLRASALPDESFVRVVLDGRKGTQMPAFKGLLTPEEVLRIRIFLKAAVPTS